MFHTDSGDIIGLLTIDKAAKGGLSQLSSIGNFYNTLASSRRDILRTLAAKEWSNKYKPEPHSLIHNVENRVIAQYGRRPFFTFFEDQSGLSFIPHFFLIHLQGTYLVAPPSRRKHQLYHS